MKNKNMRFILSFMILIVFVGLSGSRLGNKYAYSLNDDESSIYFRNISLVSDAHVSPNEKVFIELDADTTQIKNIEIELVDKNNKRFYVPVENINNKPYFVLPNYDKTIIKGNTYYLDLIHVTFINNDYITYSTGYTSGLYVSLEGKSNGSITLEDSRNDSVWRDFVNVLIPSNTLARRYDNTYVVLNADTKDIVNIALEFSDENNESFVTYLDNIDSRPFFRLGELDGEIGSTYNLSSVQVFYKDGAQVTYSTTDRHSDMPYLSIGDKRTITIVESFIEDGSYNAIEDGESTTSVTDLEVINSDYSNAFGGVVILIVLLLVAVGIFVFLKDEDR